MLSNCGMMMHPPVIQELKLPMKRYDKILSMSFVTSAMPMEPS